VAKGRRPEYRLYEQQPFRDLTGVPKDATRRCGHNGCRGQLVPERGSQHFDADGSGSVSRECNACAVSSPHYWQWSSYPPAVNEHYEG
jgi:hypothetical protein